MTKTKKIFYRSKKTNRHMSISVEGVLTQYKRRKINFCNHDDGRPMRDAEARAVFMQAKAEGKRVLPMGDCPRFDFQTGCKGHIISLMPGEGKMKEIEQEWQDYLNTKKMN